MMTPLSYNYAFNVGEHSGLHPPALYLCIVLAWQNAEALGSSALAFFKRVAKVRVSDQCLVIRMRSVIATERG